MAQAPAAKMKFRIKVLMTLMMVIGFGVLIGRLFYLQVVTGDFYRQRAVDQQMVSTTVDAKRGTIYDRNMQPLAQSATVSKAILSPAQVKEEQVDLIADSLSEILDVDRQTIVDKCANKDRYYEVVKTKVEQPQADEITRLIEEEGISGVYMEEDVKRYYPYGNFASTVLGFTNSDNVGAYGIEAYYNKTLSGTPGVVVTAKNSVGLDMPFSYQQMYEPQDGGSLVLTIDEVIQHFVEKHLETGVVEHDVRNRAVGIVMDVQTGEVLAMATKPDFDPNDPYTLLDENKIAQLEEMTEGSEEYNQFLQEAQFEQWRNKAISDPYEPGSVFKIVTASGALESKTVSLNSTFYCSGSIQVANRKISCWKAGGHGAQNFADIIKNSCNPGFITVGQMEGPDIFYEYFDNFGLTELTGIDLPGEAESIYHSLSEFKAHDPSVELASSSFGQTFKVTPIQMITAASAAVNGGRLMQPYVVGQVLDADGNVVKTTEPTVKRQVISQETSKQMALLLEKVVTEGSGSRAAIPGYRIGGKTGTSEKIDQQENGTTTEYVLSFMGFAPVDDPQVAVLVLLDEPQLNNGYGSTIAAPIVGAILNDILPYLGIEPEYTAEQAADQEVQVPYLVNYTPHDAQSVLTGLGLKTRIMGEGGLVLKQIPGAAEKIPSGGTVILYTDEASAAALTEVPAVTGLNPEQANRMLLNSGFTLQIVSEDVEAQGTVAVSQEPAAGDLAEPGSVVTVTFAQRPEDTGQTAGESETSQTEQQTGQ